MKNIVLTWFAIIFLGSQFSAHAETYKLAEKTGNVTDSSPSKKGAAPLPPIQDVVNAYKSGDAITQIKLGNMYYEGKGVAQDYIQAISLYLMAAMQGEVHGQFMLGFMYEKGKGYERDYSQALLWYRKAAAQGMPEAQFRLGFMYFNGYGVTQDFRAANYWLSLAASSGMVAAQKLGIKAQDLWMAQEFELRMMPIRQSIIDQQQNQQLLEFAAKVGQPISSGAENLSPPLVSLPQNGYSPDYQYRSNTGHQYKYDLSNPSDRIRYQVDPSAQIKDGVNPLIQIDRSMGQYGGGIK